MAKRRSRGSGYAVGHVALMASKTEEEIGTMVRGIENARIRRANGRNRSQSSFPIDREKRYDMLSLRDMEGENLQLTKASLGGMSSD